jgi:hypothetical protein
LSELGVLQPTARHHGDESPAGAVDVIHVLARTQLGIGHVEEVCASGHRLQGVPGLDVGARIAGVAVGAAKRHWHVAVGAHREDEQQLLEVRAVLLAVAVGQDWRRAPADPAAGGCAVAAAEADRGGVVVELLEPHPEALPDGQHELGQQRRAVRIVKAVQGATEPVVAQVLHVLRADAEHATGEAVHRLLLTVDRLALDDDRAQQHAQCAGVRDRAARVRGDVTRQRVVHADALDEVVDQGQRAQALGVKSEACPTRVGGGGL